MKKIEWVCTECMWQGKEDELINDSCPECGSEVERFVNESIWKYYDDFNWNRI